MSVWEILKVLFWIAVVSGLVFYFTKSVKRLLQVATGLALYETLNLGYDFLLWPVIQNKYEVAGVMWLTIGAMLINFILLKWYRKKGIDWLGITIVDDIIFKSGVIHQAFKHADGIRRFFLAFPAFAMWVAEKAIRNKVVSFLVLSTVTDSFVATAFYMHQKNGQKDVVFKKEDYFFFALSTVFNCFGWTIFNWLVMIPAVKNVWQTFIH